MKLLEVLELLNEGAFKYADADKHSGKYVRAFIDKVKSGEDIALIDGKTVKFNSKHENFRNLVKKSDDSTEILSQFLKNTKFLTKDKHEVSWTQIEKTPFSMGEDKFNHGEVAEGIMGAALAAKFMNPDDELQVDAVQGVLSRMNVQETSATVALPHKSDTSGKDIIKLSINLKANSNKALFDKKNWQNLGTEFASAVKYANSKYVTEHTKLLNSNGTDDRVDIYSIGSLDEKGTKADLKVMISIDGKQPTQANLSLSIKTGKTKNLEQSGVSYERISDIFSAFDIDISQMKESFVKQEHWYENVFKIAVNKFNVGLDQKDGENKFLRKLGSGIKYFATKDEDIVQVQLSNGDFKVLTYGGLEDKIQNHELEAQYVDSMKRPYIVIRDKKTKDTLITFRIEVRNGTEIYKLHIEGGKLLDDLTQEV